MIDMKTKPQTEEAAVQVTDLAKRYGKVQALDRVSFAIRPGEIFALLGPNGAGKTTLIRILTGLTRAGGGTFTVRGQAGVAPQSVNLDYDLSARQSLLIHGLLYGMTKKEIRLRTRELLDYTELQDKADAPVRQLSGGMKRRLLLARALLHHPTVLFLDEPTVGLDPHIRRRLWSLIKQIQQQGTTILLTTHYIEEAEKLAGRVALLDHGRLVALDTPEVLKGRMGGFAVDVIDQQGLKCHYFPDQQSARQSVLQLGENGGTVTVRPVNLEDAVVGLTSSGQEKKQHPKGNGHGHH